MTRRVYVHILTHYIYIYNVASGSIDILCNTKGWDESFLLGPMLGLCRFTKTSHVIRNALRTTTALYKGRVWNVIFFVRVPGGFTYWSFVYLPREKVWWPRKQKGMRKTKSHCGRTNITAPYSRSLPIGFLSRNARYCVTRLRTI